MKRITLIILSIVMIVSIIPLSIVSNATTNEFAGGSGTENDPYLIETKYHLDNVRNHLDAHFKMIADIEFTDADFKLGGDFYNNGVGWNPIGRFNGVFDGNNYVIKNIYIRNSSTSDISYIGLFGFNKGKITNLGIIDGDISEYSSKCDYVGGIAGYNYYGEISKCYYEGTISASSSFYVAGIIGYNEFGKINNCYNTSNITSSFHNAGITGNNYYGTITNCYNTGNIKCLECSESYHYTGGIVAKNYGTVKNCYNTGIISSYSYIGGIVGDNYSSVTNCYNTGNIINLSSVISSYDHIGAIVGHNNSSTTYCTINNCYYSCSFMNSFSNGIGGINNGSSTETPIEYTIEQMKIKSNYIGFDFNNVWEFVEGNSYPYPTLKNNEYYSINENAEFQGGDGSESAPYLIASPKQLNNVRNYLDAHFKLVINIEFADADFAEGGDFYNNGQGWLPIGTVNVPFTSTFDGNGHTIKNLYINIPSSSSNIYAGLFGYNKGTIKNLGLVDGTVSAKTTSSNTFARVGSIAGDNSYGTLLNCYNTGTVSAESSYSSASNRAYAGGIVGWSYTGTIENCYNIGDVSATSSSSDAYAGGIVGRSSFGIIKNCYNTGEISSDTYAGGITGNNGGTIENCYNTGNIFSDDTAGGVVGENYDTIEKCYNTGDVSSECAGGIVGENYSCIITNCYNTGNVSASSSSLSSYAGGIVGEHYGTIINCYNNGTVSATASSLAAYAGGIVGQTSNISNISSCYNTGAVSATSSYSSYAACTGGIVGDNSGTIENCYYLDVISKGVGKGTDTATKCTANKLKSQSTFSGFDFESIWTLAGNRCYPYPELKGIEFASEHIYDNTCDTTCDCGYTRKITHDHQPTFDANNHFDKCTVCDDVINTKAHEFDNACDTDCVCGYTRTITHNHQPTYDTQNHFDKCTVCGDVINLTTHKFDNSCDTSCDCGHVRTITHDYQTKYDSTNHWQECSVCHDTIDEKAHEFDNACDTNCNCGYIRTITHDFQTKYDTVNHWNECAVCHHMSNTKPHKFDNACDTTCDCGYIRTITHYHKPTFDANNHFDKCTVCGDIVNTKPHVFGNSCDTTCDCGYTRTITHNHKPTFDTNNHFDKCVVCGDVINSKAHMFDNACDIDCACGYVRTAPDHVYDNACDKDCNICSYTRTVPGHVYTNDCDTNCNVCNIIRTIEHKYDNSCDTSCNVCSATRTTNHKFGEYIYDNNATESADGTKTRICSVCGHKETITAEGTRLEKTIIDSSKVFKDVPANKWYKKFVDYSVTHGIFSGTSSDMFSPEQDMTRAQFVQVFANISGVDTSNRNVNSGFSDVPKGKWYTAAVTWAAQNGIVNGVGGGRFDPDSKVTREQMCVMIVNYIEKYQGKSLKVTVNASSTFADDNNISGWAKTAVYKCAKAGLVNGVGNNKFDPKASATRAQGATIFSNFYKEYMK